MSDRRILLPAACLAATVLIVPRGALAQEPAEQGAQTMEFHECLAIPPVGSGGRFAAQGDPIQAQIVTGQWAPPAEGSTVTTPGGETRAWVRLAAGDDGAFADRALAGGYAYVRADAEADAVAILEASGHSMVYVNGEPRTGDPYSTGWTQLPVALRHGPNHLLFQVARGRLQARLRLLSPGAPPGLLNTGDATLPDLAAGSDADAQGAVVVINAGTEPLIGAELEAELRGSAPVTTTVPPLMPLSIRKVGFRIVGRVPAEGDSVKLRLRLGLASAEGYMANAELPLRIRRPGQSYKRTFLSDIDGSVQYYAVQPAWPERPVGPPALVLTLHGASVEAIGQADAYSPKSWAHIVAPTNRRPYGFDWEDWGRLDAMEVLADAQRALGTDPARTYLTGHSMGGHGTWHISLTFPDRFAAIGPSAGWVSFQSYAGGRGREDLSPAAAMLLRGAAPGDTATLVRNCAQQGVYILHGSADDNVPVSEAQFMRDQLAQFHHDFVYHEQPGAGHWWDASDEPGADCVDWAPMFDLFGHHALPPLESVRQVDFTTASPGVSASCDWVRIEAQVHALQPSNVSIACDPLLRRFVGTTSNVARLSLDVAPLQPGGPVLVKLDGTEIAGLPWPATGRLWLAREGDVWTATDEPSPALKGPQRCGPFREVFRHRMLFVYGTQGSAAESAWAAAKARYDAETFWYRGNGSVEVVADVAFSPTAEPDRNVVLYGNADTNGAWAALLGESPVQVRRGAVRVGEHEYTGEDLAALFIRPRPGSATASVGAIAGSGLVGMRLTDRQPYFVSGVGYPDCLVMRADALTTRALGIRAVGFFGNDWSVETGEWVWQ